MYISLQGFSKYFLAITSCVTNCYMLCIHFSMDNINVTSCTFHYIALLNLLWQTRGGWILDMFRCLLLQVYCGNLSHINKYKYITRYMHTLLKNYTSSKLKNVHISAEYRNHKCHYPVNVEPSPGISRERNKGGILFFTLDWVK